MFWERLGVTAVVLAVIFGVFFGLAIHVNIWLGAIIGSVLMIWFIKNGIKKIKTLPLNRGILVVFGKRKKVLLGEGWHWLPIYPFIFSFIEIEVVAVNQNLPKQRVRTPDLAEIEIEASVTWVAGIEDADREKWADSFLTYLDKGGKEGVVDIIGKIVGNSLRIWILSKDGPNSWKEALASRGRIIIALVDNIINEKWETEQGRDAAIRELGQGSASFGNSALGITVNRLSINNILVVGEVARAAEKAEKERLEREADKIEIQSILERARELCGENISNISPEEAYKIIQTERGKASRTIIDINGAQTGIGQDLIGLAAIVGGLVKNIKGVKAQETAALKRAQKRLGY